MKPKPMWCGKGPTRARKDWWWVVGREITRLNAAIATFNARCLDIKVDERCGVLVRGPMLCTNLADVRRQLRAAMRLVKSAQRTVCHVTGYIQAVNKSNQQEDKG